MKLTILSFLLLMVFCNIATSQNYYVVNTEGKVYSGDLILKTGDKLSDISVITFTSAGDKLYLMSPAGGNYLIRPAVSSEKNSPGWIITLKNAVIPQNKYYKTASRSNEPSRQFDDIYDLMGFFRENVMIIGETRFEVNREKIPLDEHNFFSFRSLSGRGTDSVVCSSCDGFFKIEVKETGNPSLGEFEMIYVQGNKEIPVGKFRLVSRTRSDIMKELGIYFNAPGSADPGTVYYEQVIPYINHCYGNTDPETIKDIIRNDLHVKLNVRE